MVALLLGKYIFLYRLKIGFDLLMYLLVIRGSTPETAQFVMKNDTLRVKEAPSGKAGNNSD